MRFTQYYGEKWAKMDNTEKCWKWNARKACHFILSTIIMSVMINWFAIMVNKFTKTAEPAEPCKLGLLLWLLGIAYM